MIILSRTLNLGFVFLVELCHRAQDMSASQEQTKDESHKSDMRKLQNLKFKTAFEEKLMSTDPEALHENCKELTKTHGDLSTIPHFDTVDQCIEFLLEHSEGFMNRGREGGIFRRNLLMDAAAEVVEVIVVR